MPNPLQITLTETQRQELEKLRDSGKKAYLRERAAAILKIASGMSASAVAQQGLLRKRKHQTIGEWVQRYKREGVKGLVIRSGRGRKPAFSPNPGHG